MKNRAPLTTLLALSLLVMSAWITPTAKAADLTITLAPGEEVTIPLRLWCLDYGKPFPTALGAPGPRAQDEVVAVLQTAIAKGTVVTEIYQTELAIWRVPTGKFNDFAKQGTTLAEEIYAESNKQMVAAIPESTLTLDEAVADGSLTYEILDFGPSTESLAPAVAAATPFFGTADLVVRNPTDKAVKFLFPEGTFFPPAGGQNAQNLLSHQDPLKSTILPASGAPTRTALSALFLAAGLFLTGWTIRRSRLNAN